MKLIKHGTAGGANAYKTEDGRFYVSASFSTQSEGRPRQRWWKATDSARKDQCGYEAVVASAHTLDRLKERLMKYVTSESSRRVPNPAEFKVLTVGEWARLPVGTVMERDNGLLYIVSKDGGRGNGITDPWVVMGDPTQPFDEVTTQGAVGRVRFVGDAPEDTLRALGSLARIEWFSGKRAALVPCPGALEDIVGRGASTAAGEQALVDAVIRRAAVYGKDATYTGTAELGGGMAIVYLHWPGDKAPKVDMGWAR